MRYQRTLAASHVSFGDEIALEIVVNEDFLDRTVDTIMAVSRTGPEGNIGDGKIFVLPCDEAIDVGLMCRGPEAV